jgi:hypothetical protein
LEQAPALDQPHLAAVGVDRIRVVDDDESFAVPGQYNIRDERAEITSAMTRSTTIPSRPTPASTRVNPK